MVIRIGIRELRQNASQYLRRVREGETVVLTDRGAAFAEIRPLKRDGGILARMIAEGRATPATGNLREYLDKHPPAPPMPGQRRSLEVLDEQREERL